MIPAQEEVLREAARYPGTSAAFSDAAEAALAEIDRLRAENEHLRGLLERVLAVARGELSRRRGEGGGD
jgi:hypothetical protein